MFGCLLPQRKRGEMESVQSLCDTIVVEAPYQNIMENGDAKREGERTGKGEGEEHEWEFELEAANCLLLGLDTSVPRQSGAPRVGLFTHSYPRMGETLLCFLLCTRRVLASCGIHKSSDDLCLGCRGLIPIPNCSFLFSKPSSKSLPFISTPFCVFNINVYSQEMDPSVNEFSLVGHGLGDQVCKQG
eukprot:Gb_24661 [translate_table: standard]